MGPLLLRLETVMQVSGIIRQFRVEEEVIFVLL
jgi:hypothetical protein